MIEMEAQATNPAPLNLETLSGRGLMPSFL